MDKYEKLELIGEGAFGSVYKALNKENSQVVAMKCLKQRYRRWDDCLNLKEVKALSKLKHPNIIKLKEVFKKDDVLHMIFEYAENNLLEHYSKQYKAKGLAMPESEIRDIVGQVAKALAFMHKNGFFHRDLKPENILITSDGVVKLADFGLAREIRSAPPFTDYVATRWYRAPEILLKSRHYSSPVDIFALGCIMAELYVLRPLFTGKSEVDQLFKICEGLGYREGEWVDGERWANLMGVKLPGESAGSLEQLLGGVDNDAVALIKAMLEINSVRRVSAQQIMGHPYFGAQVPLATSTNTSKTNLNNLRSTSKLPPMKTRAVLDQHMPKLVAMSPLDSPGHLPVLNIKKSSKHKDSINFNKDKGLSKFDRELLALRRQVDSKYSSSRHFSPYSPYSPYNPFSSRVANQVAPQVTSKYSHYRPKANMLNSKTEYNMSTRVKAQAANSTYHNHGYSVTVKQKEASWNSFKANKETKAFDEEIDAFMNDSLFRTKERKKEATLTPVDHKVEAYRYDTEDTPPEPRALEGNYQPSYLRGLNLINKF